MSNPRPTYTNFEHDQQFGAKVSKRLPDVDKEVTKVDIGLGNVDNTSDADKPISNSTNKALLKKLEFGTPQRNYVLSSFSLTSGDNIGKVKNSFVWVEFLNMFVSVGGSNQTNSIFTSPNAKVWSMRTTPSAQLYSVACNDSIVVAVGAYGAFILTSTDGITWTQRTPDVAGASVWNSVIWSKERGLFVAVGDSSLGRLMTSPDGITWTVSTALPSVPFQSVSYSPQLDSFVAVSYSPSPSGTIVYSQDLINWSSATAPNGRWWGVCWSNRLSLFCVVGFDGQRIATSPDGITWTGRSAPNTNGWRSVIYAEELGVFFAVANSGTDRLMWSSDGINWTALSGFDFSNAYIGPPAWSPTLGIFVTGQNTSPSIIVSNSAFWLDDYSEQRKIAIATFTVAQSSTNAPVISNFASNNKQLVVPSVTRTSLGEYVFIFTLSTSFNLFTNTNAFITSRDSSPVYVRHITCVTEYAGGSNLRLRVNTYTSAGALTDDNAFSVMLTVETL